VVKPLGVCRGALFEGLELPGYNCPRRSTAAAGKLRRIKRKKKITTLWPHELEILSSYSCGISKSLIVFGVTMPNLFSDKTVLITGANGEIGHSLCHALLKMDVKGILALDVHPQTISCQDPRFSFIQGDILDKALIESLASRKFDFVFHLAALLSTRAEMIPVMAHRVNVEGTLNLLEAARVSGIDNNEPVRFIFPSTIAAYGLPDDSSVDELYCVEDQFCSPITMYGINKIYVEKLGAYYRNSFASLDNSGQPQGRVDFRALRFPGLLSADSVPTGGTSDYGPQMLHNAAKGEKYSCFVTPETRIPFMAMPDAVRALLEVSSAASSSIKQPVYNVNSFSITASEIRDITLSHFPGSEIDFLGIDQRRLKIVKSWPRYIDDSAARKDWGWKAEYDLKTTFSDYLVPGVKRRYQKG
jgi:nucleoside-diphosphate-sugar epimerase